MTLEKLENIKAQLAALEKTIEFEKIMDEHCPGMRQHIPSMLRVCIDCYFLGTTDTIKLAKNELENMKSGQQSGFESKPSSPDSTDPYLQTR